MTHEQIADLRVRIGKLSLHPVLTGYAYREVAERNITLRAQVLDAVLLDDLWRVLDDLCAEIDAVSEEKP